MTAHYPEIVSAVVESLMTTCRCQNRESEGNSEFVGLNASGLQERLSLELTTSSATLTGSVQSFPVFLS